MQYLEIKSNTTLTSLSDVVGERNIDSVLNINQLPRTMKIGKSFDNLCNETIATSKAVDWQRKTTILNSLTADSDVYEEAALLNENQWKILSNLGTFPGRLRIPQTLKLPDSTQILGNGRRVNDLVYRKSINQLKSNTHSIDPSIFSDYSARPHSSRNVYSVSSFNNVFQDFKIPWGDILLYDSLSRQSIDIPGYPEELDDERTANYETMPDLLYQYEPWQVYTSSGPRSATYTWELHRQMWNGDERDGKANELIRFCQSCLYPDYKGSAVFTPTVTLYIKGFPLITGVLTNVSVKYSGPIGLDGFYLAFSLALTFIEVANQPLNHNSVRRLPVIG